MIVYASLGLVVQHDGEADDERCLCGAPHGHPTARAEFMAEVPVKPKSRSRKPQPASLSMFEWALGMEREAEPVGAGR